MVSEREIGTQPTALNTMIPLTFTIDCRFLAGPPLSTWILGPDSVLDVVYDSAF